MSGWRKHLEDIQERSLDDLKALLRIPSVSSLPAYSGDVRFAAEWTARRLEQAGLENVAIRETAGHPVVTADWLHAADRPTILIYGHYDVQPADPLELWTSPPFEPEIRDDRIYARGANDDKGNLLAPILAVEAMLTAEESLPINVRFFFEGEEEIGSPSLPRYVADNPHLFDCDTVVSADGGQFSEDIPALLVGLKGLAAAELVVTGPDRDLHSGVYGGAVQNPIHALAHILASFRDIDGTIAVEGFYDQVLPLTEDERRHIATVPNDPDQYRDDLGVDALYGEPGYSTLERAWARPTLEINGITGGFQGDGVKTVIPQRASAKITCRLVPDQRPSDIIDRLRRHVERHTPPGVRVELQALNSHADPYLVPPDHPGNLAAADVLSELYGRDPLWIRSGGSIPVCGIFRAVLGVYTVIFAFALEDERQHSPDEFFRLSSFSRAQVAWGMLIERMAC